MKTIFYVYNTFTRYTNYEHHTLESAKSEAERLAREHPGQCFRVLSVIGEVKSNDVVWDCLENNPAPDIPF